MLAGCGGTQPQQSAQQPQQSMEQQVDQLLDSMNVDEKIGQMMNSTPGIERLGIKPYDWWNEGLHGVGRSGRATVFPQPIGLGATFDIELLNSIGDAISDEARAKYQVAQRIGNYGRYAGLTFWSPNVNIFRDPRWGRGMETYGEDPYLTERHSSRGFRATTRTISRPQPAPSTSPCIRARRPHDTEPMSNLRSRISMRHTFRHSRCWSRTQRSRPS